MNIESVTGQSRPCPIVGANGRLTSVGGVSYTYDDNGSLTNDGIYTYTCPSASSGSPLCSEDVAGRLVGVESITTTVVYTYNGNGVRVAQSIDGVETRWVQDQASALAQVLLEVTGGETTVYLLGLGRLAQVADGNWEWFLGDALGSVRQVVDDTGAVLLARDYSPFGLLRAESGTGSSGYGFTGEQGAVPGLVHLRARLYSPSLGRFLSVDPFPGYAGVPQTQHAYAYCFNNPTALVDPSGQLPPWPWLQRLLAGVASLLEPSRPPDPRYPTSMESRYPRAPIVEPVATPRPVVPTVVSMMARPGTTDVPLPPEAWLPEPHACWRRPETWLILLYKRPGTSVWIWENVLLGGEVKIPVPQVPWVNLGGEAELRNVTYVEPWTMHILEQEIEWTTKPTLGAGASDVLNVTIGPEFSSEGSVNVEPELSIELPGGNLEFQPGQVLFKREFGWSPWITAKPRHSAAYGVGWDPADTRWILTTQEIVSNAGGFQDFGQRYVEPGYQFVQVFKSSTHKGLLLLQAHHMGIVLEEKPGP